MEPISADLTEEVRRGLAQWAADCAERALPLFERTAPNDDRVRRAIEGTRSFVLDGNRTRELRALCWSTYAAVRSSDNLTESLAARAAAYAVAVPYIGTAENPYGALQVLGSAVYVAHAFEHAAANDPRVGDAEIDWAIARAPSAVRKVVLRMPAHRVGRSRVSTMLYRLQIGLRR